MTTEFFDSAPRVFPPGARYAALYADGDFKQPHPPGIPNVRWITVDGGAAAAAYAGIIDFERGNPAYLGAALGDYAGARIRAGHKARVYCNRSDVHPAFAQVDHMDVWWWIATLDNSPHWTPKLIVASVRAMTGITLPVDRIWGVQWGTNSRYDTSYLFAEW
jgi:hypothetical protein